MVLTRTAAKSLETLAPPLRSAVLDFLKTKFPGYAESHEPKVIDGLTGKYWVVSPSDAGGAVSLMVTKREDGSTGGSPDFVVASVLSQPVPSAADAAVVDPGTARLATELIRSTELV